VEAGGLDTFLPFDLTRALHHLRSFVVILLETYREIRLIIPMKRLELRYKGSSLLGISYLDVERSRRLIALLDFVGFEVSVERETLRCHILQYTALREQLVLLQCTHDEVAHALRVLLLPDHGVDMKSDP